MMFRRSALAIAAATLGVIVPVVLLAHRDTSHGPRLGKVLATADGGEIFGFDIDHEGSDGVLASALPLDSQGNVRVSVETFDQDTGAITRSFATYQGKRNEYAVDGIFAGDAALVTHDITPAGSIFATRRYEVMNPVTRRAFTGAWTAPARDIDVQQVGTDQTSATAVLLAIELKRNDRPLLVVTDVATNMTSKALPLPAGLFGGADGPRLGLYAAGHQAVIAVSPDAGAVGGEAPLNVLVDLASGAMTQFSGYNLGPFHAGYVNGLAVDPATGVAATDTELNAQVEFYDLGKKQGIAAVQLPCTGPGDELNSGSGIAVDPIHKLFLVTETYYCGTQQNGAIVVYDETGKFVETIAGFAFPLGAPAPAINPAKRMGWALNGDLAHLRQFFY